VQRRSRAPATDAAGLKLPTFFAFTFRAQRLRRRYAGELALLPPGAHARSMAVAYEALRASRGLDVPSALRVLRQLVLERLMVLDCDQQAPLATVTSAVTELAEFALDIACSQAFHDLDLLHGAPRTPEGKRAQLWVVGMGKLGARELNVSSDIDLVYVYDQDGETAGSADGRGRITNHEYFAKAVKAIYGLIGDVTEHGFVFRVDLALRPNGNSGPQAVSLGALEEYFLVQGREWERFAWMKSRVVAPRACIDDGSAQALRGAVLPFVFRRYLDYACSTRCGCCTGRSASTRRGARRAGPSAPTTSSCRAAASARSNSSCSCCRWCAAASSPNCARGPTLQALQRLARAGLMTEATAQALAAGLHLPAPRRAPHPVPGRPADPRADGCDDDLGWIAQTMGYADCCPFLHELDGHRELVAEEFDKLLGGATECKACVGPSGNGKAPPPDLDDLLDQLPRNCATASTTGASIRACWRCATTPAPGWPAGGAHRAVAGAGPRHRGGGLRMADWIEPLLRRESYLALLVERPGVHERLLRLLGAARWPARYLMQHPGVIDELASDDLLTGPLQRRRLRARAGTPAPLVHDHRRGRRRNPAEPAAARPPRGAVPHAGARRRRRADRRTGGRRTERAGRRHAARHGALVLAAPEAAASRRAACSPSSATASWEARNWATAATSTSCSSTRTRTSARPRPMPPSCAS
jgi:glutamate-ammonia-ligase adenylyltransferase